MKNKTKLTVSLTITWIGAIGYDLDNRIKTGMGWFTIHPTPINYAFGALVGIQTYVLCKMYEKEYLK